MDRVVEFYRGRIADHRGRWLHEIQQWSDHRLEDVHDFIQWCFPLREPSPVNPHAPRIDDQTIAAFREDAALRDALRLSFERMVRFYGFEFYPGSSPRVEPSREGAQHSANWLTPGNHNHLRITRILKCLMLLGLRNEAYAFFVALEKVNATESAKREPGITRQTFEFWQKAVANETI